MCEVIEIVESRYHVSSCREREGEREREREREGERERERERKRSSKVLNRLLLCMIQHTRNEMIKEKTSRRENSLTLTSTTPNLTPSLGLGVFLFPFNAERTGLPSPFLITDGVLTSSSLISLTLSHSHKRSFV